MKLYLPISKRSKKVNAACRTISFSTLTLLLKIMRKYLRMYRLFLFLVDNASSVVVAVITKAHGRVLNHTIMTNNILGTLLRWLIFMIHAPEIDKLLNYFEEILSNVSRNQTKLVSMIDVFFYLFLIRNSILNAGGFSFYFFLILYKFFINTCTHSREYCSWGNKCK